MTSNHHALYVLGYTRATMVGTTRSYLAIRCKSLKADPSSDRSLQFDYVKQELLVIANQNVVVNTFPGLVHTARHTMEVGNARSQQANRKEAAVEGRVDD